MKTIFFIIVFCACMIKSAEAQQSKGTSGLLNTPSADFHPDGTFSLGVNYLPTLITPDRFDYPTLNYYLNITYFSFLELTYKMTLLRMQENDNKFSNQDRSMEVRLRLLKESRILPAVVIGSSDFLTSKFISVIANNKSGNQYFGTLYAVTTKNLLLQGNNLGLTIGYSFHTQRTDKFTGVLAGIRYNPSFYRPLSIIAEYDTKNFNLGASALLFNHFNIQLYTIGFKQFSAGISYQLQLKTFDKIKP